VLIGEIAMGSALVPGLEDEMVGIVGLAIVVMALATATIAERRGQSALAWFLVALFLPVVALVILLVTVPHDPVGTEGTSPSVVDAVRASPVARALSTQPGVSAHQLARTAALEERDVVGQLRAMRNLELAAPDDGGRWRLTPAGRAAMDA
jgi:hypothetical protein